MILILVLAIAGLVASSYYIVNQTERGVILRTGRVIGVAEPGLHFMVPLLDSVVLIPIQTLLWRGVLPTYSKDQQPTELTASVNWRAQPTAVAEILEKFGSLEGLLARLVEPRTLSSIKTTFGQLNAATAIQARAAALGDNPGLVELVKAERRNGQLPTTVLPDSALPFLGAGPR